MRSDAGDYSKNRNRKSIAKTERATIMRNTFYTYYTYPKNDPTGLAKFGVRAKSVKQALENWQFTK